MRYLVFVLVLFLFLAGCDALKPKPATVVSCKDSDGNDANVKGSVTLELSDGTKKTKQDECAAPETVDEAICPKSGLSISTQKIVCPSGPCVNGVCTERTKTTVEKSVETKEESQVTILSCTDSDGEDANTKGSVTIELSNGTKKTKEDVCISASVLYEMICPAKGLEINVKNIPCAPGTSCKDGICK